MYICTIVILKATLRDIQLRTNGIFSFQLVKWEQKEKKIEPEHKIK